MYLSKRSVFLLNLFISFCIKIKLFPIKWNQQEKIVELNIAYKAIKYFQICPLLLYTVYLWITFILILNGILYSPSTMSTEIHYTFCLAGTTATFIVTNFWLNTEEIIGLINKSILLWKNLNLKFSIVPIKSLKVQLLETMLQLIFLDVVIFQQIFLIMFYLLDPYNKRYPVWLFINSESNELSKIVAVGTVAIIYYIGLFTVYFALWYVLLLSGYLFGNIGWLKILTK